MSKPYVLCKVEPEACAVAVGARRGREGNLVRTLIRPNGWCKVARSADTRQETVDTGDKEEISTQRFLDGQRG